MKRVRRQFSLGAIDYATVLTAQAAATQAALALYRQTWLPLDIALLRMIMAAWTD